MLALASELNATEEQVDSIDFDYRRLSTLQSGCPSPPLDMAAFHPGSSGGFACVVDDCDADELGWDSGTEYASSDADFPCLIEKCWRWWVLTWGW